MRAEVIAIGDELTSGQRLDTNSQWISQRLTELGIEVAFHSTVGDELEDNIDVFRTAFRRADVVVTTGGLGPTADDLTRDALAQATEKSLIRDEEILEHIRQLFSQRGREMPERNAVQADFPEGAKPIPNSHGTAPGIEMQIAQEGHDCSFFALPGVPAEMHEMWSETVVPALERSQPEPQIIRQRRIKCFGAGESQLEAMLPGMTERGREPRVGITVSDATITLRITARGPTEAACYASMEPTIATIRELLGTLVFGEEDDELEDVVVRVLKEQQKSVAIAEWATAGRVNGWITAIAEEDPCYAGGEVIGSLQDVRGLATQSSLHTDIEPDSTTMATMLAEAVRDRYGSDFGLGIAAFPQETENPTARVYVSLATPTGTKKLRFGCASHPAIKMGRTAKQALNALRLTLLKNDS